jgi:hypothetical protein
MKRRYWGSTLDFIQAEFIVERVLTAYLRVSYIAIWSARLHLIDFPVPEGWGNYARQLWVCTEFARNLVFID